jgi:hypothetical protein
VGGKGLYREGKVGGNDFMPKKRIKEEGKIYILDKMGSGWEGPL